MFSFCLLLSEETTKLFSRVAVPLHIVYSNVRAIQFPCLLTNVAVLAILIGVCWHLTVVFICISLMADNMVAIFSVLICHLCILFSEPFLVSFAHILIGLFAFFFKILFFKDFYYLFLEIGEGREKERETSMCGYLSRAGIELETLWFIAHAQSTELHQPGLKAFSSGP